MRFRIFPFLFCSAGTEQIIPDQYHRRNYEQYRDPMRQKQHKRHADTGTEQDQSDYLLHLMTPF